MVKLKTEAPLDLFLGLCGIPGAPLGFDCNIHRPVYLALFRTVAVAVCSPLYRAVCREGSLCAFPCLPWGIVSDPCIVVYKRWLTHYLFLSPTCLYSTHYVRTVLLSWCWPTSYSLFINSIVLCNLALVPGGAGVREYLLPNY